MVSEMERLERSRAVFAKHKINASNVINFFKIVGAVTPFREIIVESAGLRLPEVYAVCDFLQ